MLHMSIILVFHCINWIKLMWHLKDWKPWCNTAAEGMDRKHTHVHPKINKPILHCCTGSKRSLCDLTVRLSIAPWITYYQCCYKYPPDEPHSHKDPLVCFNRNLRMKKDMETLDTIVQSHLNAWVDGFTAKRFTEITRAAMT